MKAGKFIIALTVMGLSMTAFAQNRPSRNSLLKLADETVDRIYEQFRDLTLVQKRAIRADLRSINRTLNGNVDPDIPPTPPRASYYCAAGCKTFNGGVSLDNAVGVRAHNSLEGEELAIEAVRNKYNCSYGVKLISCEDQRRNSLTTCTAGCKEFNGGLSNSNLEVGDGYSELEAYINASAEVKKNVTCSYGVRKGTCTTKQERTYCSAACKEFNGGASSYSAGAYGDNEIVAKVNAFKAVKKKYTCSYGFVIKSCAASN